MTGFSPRVSPTKAAAADTRPDFLAKRRSSGVFTELFEQAWAEGYTDLIHTSINSKGSATCSNALQARSDFYQDHPEAKNAFHVHIIAGFPLLPAQLYQLGNHRLFPSDLGENLGFPIQKGHDGFQPQGLAHEDSFVLWYAMQRRDICPCEDVMF